MQKTLIIYESEYGTTEKIAKCLSLVLGPAKYCKTTEFGDDYKDFDFLVIGSPIYSGKVLPKITEFIDENIKWIEKKNIALFCTCISPKDGNENLIALEKIIGKVMKKRALGGTLKLNRLNNTDSQSLKNFSEKVGFPLSDMDNFHLEEVIDFALELKLIKEDLIPKLPPDELKDIIEEFLTGHNTCTLSSSYKNRVRSTPIEYNYYNGYIYLLSEGGEKFTNILLNKNVSLAIYEEYTNMNNLAGMQITGTASIVEDEEEYENIITIKGLNLKFTKNMLKITIQKIEFLYSEFKKKGYEPKQIFKIN